LGGGGSGGCGSGGGVGGSGSGSITTVASGLVGLTTSNQNTETQYEQELFHGTILCQKNLSFIILYDNRHWGNTDSFFDAQSKKQRMTQYNHELCEKYK
jgi:hypothetical protein